MHRKPRTPYQIRIREVRIARARSFALRTGRQYRTTGHGVTLDITGLVLIAVAAFQVPVAGHILGFLVAGVSCLVWRLRG